MDALGSLLDSSGRDEALVLRCLFEPPWAVSVEDGRLAVLAITSGTVRIEGLSDEPVVLEPGDVAVISNSGKYRIDDGTGSPLVARVDENGDCRTLQGEPLVNTWSRGTRTWGNTSACSATCFLMGNRSVTASSAARLLAVLPPVIVVRSKDAEPTLTTLLCNEIDRIAVGQDVVLDRIVDLLLVGSVRHWLASATHDSSSWWAAQADPVVGPALRAIHAAPARPWTIATLATEAMSSRGHLARRFTELLGEPPMTYLTRWRLGLAADLLQDPDLTLAAIAQRVGYGSAFSLSSAFKREYGTSPREFRQRRAG